MRRIVALDAMGGDFGLEVTVPAALEALQRYRELEIILVGQRERIEEALAQASERVCDRLRIVHASEVVAMDELPSRALRNKRDSSMRRAIQLVADGEAQACVSAGNTGALMALARHILKTLPGIDRPAILVTLPTRRGRTHILDMGANVDCSADHLFQFAVMGSELVRAVEGIERPKVGLLNIGEEEIKGNEQVKRAFRLLANTGLNFIGYVEGNDIYTGDVDVVVTDGFVGNIVLKASEGLAQFLSEAIRREFLRDPLSRIAAIFAAPVLKRFRRRFDPRRYNGASFLGLQGIVIKSHGNADSFALAQAVGTALREIEMQVPRRIATLLEQSLATRRFG